MMEWKGIPITDGTTQQDRQLAALLPGYFNVDEMAFEDLLAMGAEIAANIKYYNLSNEVDGDWGELFSADEAVVMASILSTDLALIETGFNRVSSGKPDGLPQFLFDLAARIDTWYTCLSASETRPAELLAQKIARIISEKLAAELHKLCDMVHVAELASDLDYSTFSPVWGLGASGLVPATVVKSRNAGDATQQLSASFYVFSSAISNIKTTSAVFLQQSLGNGQHEPAIALFMVFLKMYERAQNRLNRFTPRFLDFYYQQVLKAGNRERVSGSYYLRLEIQPGRDKALVEKHTEFIAGKDAELNEIVYWADEDLLVTDARVEALATLNLQHEELVSPEFDLGAVTRIKSDLPQLPHVETATKGAEDSPGSWSLFGAEHPDVVKASSTDASLGFCIASANLLLAQGLRKVDIGIELESVLHANIDVLVSGVLRSDSQQEFRQAFGSLFAYYLLSFNGCLTPSQKSEIQHKADALLPNNSSREINSLLSQDWQGLFYRLFRKLFSIKLTTETGWLDVQDYILLPYTEDPHQRKTGFRILLSLGREVEPITPYNVEVHGGQMETELPVLRCVINPQTNFFPYSIFQSLAIISLQISVDVSGVKNAQVYNQHGQLDPSKPFQPFGPMPGSKSYFIFGSYELARKQLLELKIHLDWGELPVDAGGFDEYYHAYETRYGNNAFKGAFSVLADGRWVPDSVATKNWFNLFESETSGGRISTSNAVTINRPDYFTPIDARFAESDFGYSLEVMAGFYRLSLVAPDSAFGHSEYAQLLSKVMTANVRLKKPKPVPNPPYTPTLNGITLDYKASTTIFPALPTGENKRVSEKIMHVHPFGMEAMYPPVNDRPCFLMPQYVHEGNLFIGLSGTRVSGPLCLLFHLSQDMTEVPGSENTTIDWYYLASNSWNALPAENLLSDTTHGFQVTGIVTLDIPPDITRRNTVMPADLFWLRISVREGAGSFSSCQSVELHGLKVSLKAGAGDAVDQGVTQAANWSSVRTLPGIGKITQIGQSFGGRPGENTSARNARIGERLRHKNRALLPRDYEQLILEHFPEIYKVKCFNSLSSTSTDAKPGHVLITVVPNSGAANSESCAHSMINAQLLGQIKDHVKNLCSEFVDIEVRNPVYEQVQVRCTVKFVSRISEGVDITRLNRHISDYMCPWKPGGYQARFGWKIRQQEIESYIRSLSYIEYVTNFSMLHITIDTAGRYHLFDTAKGGQDQEAVITPRYPWSLALPAEDHFIETMPTARTVSAEITGVDELAVGSTFIISGSNGNGEEE